MQIHVLQIRVMRIFVVLLSVCFAVSLVSCEEKKKAVELTEITMWYTPSFSDAPPPPADWELYQKLRNQLGIKLVLIPVSPAEKERAAKIEQAVRSKSLPDIFCVSREQLASLAKRGEITRIDRLFPLMPVRTEKMYDAEAKMAGTVDRIPYGLAHAAPVERDSGILIRKDWLDNLNIPIPVTLDDFFDVMRRFTFLDPDGNGKHDTYGYGAYLDLSEENDGLGTQFDPFFGAFGVAGTFNMTERNAGLNIRKYSYYGALEFVSKMTAAKVIDPNWLAYHEDEFRKAWRSGKFGMMKEQFAAYSMERSYVPFDENFPKGKWIVINPPVGPRGDKSVGTYAKRFKIYAVSRNAAEQGKLPAIARLLEWMSTEGYKYLSYGEENVNYRIDYKGDVTTQGLEDENLAYTNDSFTPYLQLRDLVFYSSEKEFPFRYPTWASKNGKEISPKKVLDEMHACPWTPAFGAGNLPVATSELRQFYENGIIDFVTGKRSLSHESWSAWLDEFDRRGGLVWERQCISFAKENNLLTK